jgi:lipid II:glycine glycyltransferase (peptidoglycan interpeptide bridge formation enzyme)
MDLFYFSEAAELNNFIKSAGDQLGAEFLESWSWGEIRKAEGQKVLRIGARESGPNGPVKAAATLIKTSLFGSYFYWYSPRGPVGEGKAKEFLLEAVKNLDPRAIFWRFEPEPLFKPSSLSSEGIKIADEIKVKEGKIKIKKTLNLQPAQTLFLDLSRSEEELLAAMRQKTRYNIRLAEKKGVTVNGGGLKDMAELQRLLRLTGERDKFRLHSRRHYENLLKTGGGVIKLFLARYQEKNIAAALVSFFGGRATYLHGASDNASREVMAPHSLQWEIIKRAKKAGYKYYDFYGLDAVKWPGVTRFKLGFGGRTVGYPGTFDAVYRPVIYNFYQLARKLKRLI